MPNIEQGENAKRGRDLTFDVMRDTIVKKPKEFYAFWDKIPESDRNNLLKKYKNAIDENSRDILDSLFVERVDGAVLQTETN